MKEVTPSMIPGGSLAIAGKQFLRGAFKQAFERVGGVDAIVDWVNPEVPVYQRDDKGKVMVDEAGDKIILRFERKRNDANFGQLLSLMAKLEPKEVTVNDERSIEATIEAIEAEFTVVEDGDD